MVKPEVRVSVGLALSGTLGRLPPCLFPASGGGWQFLAALGLQQHHSNLCLRHHVAFSLCVSFCFFSSKDLYP